MRPSSCPIGALAIVAVASIVLSGCGAGHPGAKAGGTVVHVAERDFHIKVPKRLPAGDLVLSVRNRGPDAHELIVIRKTSAGFPLRSDGSTLDEEGLEKAEAGALEPGDPRGVRELRVHLTPGRYEFLCNMAGHYLGGMRKQVVVE
jgi:uncharacterized cupredoxin-like copper-binding protein